MQGSLRAARSQYDRADSTGNSQLRVRARGNLKQAIQSKVGMLKGRHRGLQAKKEAAFNKAQALEQAGDKAGAEVYLNKAINYESRAKSISSRINRLSDTGYQDKLVNRYERRRSVVGTSAGIGASTPAVESASNSSARSAKPGKAASFGYSSAKKAYLGHQKAARTAYQRYKQTGDPSALRQMRANGVNRVRAKVSMYKAQAKGLQAKAAAAAAAGNGEQAALYAAKADKLAGRAQRLSTAASRFETKFKAGQLRDPRRRGTTAAAAEDGPQGSADGPEMDFGGPQAGAGDPAHALVQQAADHESAPGVDGPDQQRSIPGIASGRGKRTAKIQLSNGNIMGALGTLKQMEAQANRGGMRGLVDRYRKWSTKRRVMKQAYKTGKQAARVGDLELAQEALHAVTDLGKPGWRTNRKVMSIGNQALKGAKGAAKHRNPEQAFALLDFARNVQMAMGRQKPTIRFRLVRRTAKGRLWKDMKRRSKEGNLEAFRSAMRLASAYAQEDGKRLGKGELRQIRKLYKNAVKRSVVRALDDAQLLLSGKMGYVNVEEAAKRLAYAEQTADKLARRGVEVKTRSFLIFRKSLHGKFKRVRKQLVKSWQEQNQIDGPKKPGLFARWWKMGGARGAPNIAPVPRSPAEVAKERRMQQEQQAVMEAAQSGQLTPEMLQQLPPEMLQQMGLQ